MAAIQLHKVSKTFQTDHGAAVAALSGIDLSVREGEFVSIVGRSGCGKSTLLRLVAGLDSASSGSIRIADVDTVRPDKRVRYVFQNYADSLFRWKSVGNNIAFGLRHSGARDADRALTGEQVSREIEQRLAEVGLPGIAARYPSELSGGQQQRVAIARALASRPQVLLLDEAFSAVDALSRNQLQDLLLDIWQEHGLTAVFVTHDIEEAIYLADRVIVLGPGRGILDEIEVDLPRPRHQVNTREHPEFLRLRKLVYQRVTEEQP